MKALRMYQQLVSPQEVRDHIVAKSEGRICGDCRYARLNERGQGWCTMREGLRYAWVAPELAINRRDAVACDSWKVK